MSTENTSDMLRRCYFRGSSQLSCLNVNKERWEKLNVSKKQDQAWTFCVACVALLRAASIEPSMLIVRSVAGLFIDKLVYKQDGVTVLSQAKSPTYGLYVKDGVALAQGQGRFSHLRAGYCAQIMEHADVFHAMACDAMKRAYTKTENEKEKKQAIEAVTIDGFKQAVESMAS